MCECETKSKIRTRLEVIDFGERVLMRWTQQADDGEWEVTRTGTADTWNEALSKALYGGGDQ